MIPLSGFHKGLLPFGVIHRIREKLGLQANAAALGIAHTALSNFVGIVGRIQLNAGAIGAHRHATTALRICQIGAGITEYLKIMVIAGLKH